RTRAIEAEEQFWGESFALTHWLRKGRAPLRLSLERVLAVASGCGAVRDMTAAAAPTGRAGLPAAEEELAMLRRPGAGGEVLPARRRELRQALERGGFTVLHLASHGSFGGVQAADASAVQLEDGAFTVAELSARLEEALRRTAPLVFFNACHSGRLGFAL